MRCKMKKQGMNGINNGHFGVLGKEYGILGGRPSKSVLQFTKDGEFVNEFKSLTEATHATGANLGNLSNHLKGLSKSCVGYVWKFKVD